MNAATSPVCAPSSATGAQSWAEIFMLEPSKRSATDFKAVNTGAITTSQWFALATSGFNASAVATESPTVLYIFQLPAMTGFLIRTIFVFCTLFFVFCQEFSAPSQPRQSTKHQVQSTSFIS